MVMVLLVMCMCVYGSREPSQDPQKPSSGRTKELYHGDEKNELWERYWKGCAFRTA